MTVLYSQTITTPLGQMLITASTRGVCLAEFAGTPRMERESRDLERLFKARTEPGGNEHTAQAAQELSAYFRGGRQRFTVALDTPGTDFQRQVWTALRDIPYGTTSHYQALAAAIGKPAAVRAVAAANGANRVAILIPCHRVIGKHGALIGYGGGLPRKAWLLSHERGGRNHSLPDLFVTLQEYL
ncbi:MAG: methylated-DNA--[protein]-cysteine S-methyltransferase [Cardiobacterium sp.]|nr:MAG: methylated-DNA--[protein]-cysteine S-methyltransferase [Cardiobacterium sp.]